MAYMHEFPHSRTFDSDLREILEMYNAVKKLPDEWKNFKTAVLEEIEKQVAEFLDDNFEDILNRYLYDVTYDSKEETIYYARKEGNS